MKLRTIQGILIGVVIGVAVGISVYTFAYAKGWSYLTDNPAACANCHVMREQFDGWLKSSHRAVATCNSCHTPANLIGKYATKASNGFWHSFFFTTGGYEDNIQIKPHSLAITEQACRNCLAKLSMLSKQRTRHRAPGSSPACVATTRWDICNRERMMEKKYRNNGMVENWNDAFDPKFQHSNIPLFQYSNSTMFHRSNVPLFPVLSNTK
ncbi:MAG TPA: cytochrome c nitrite reductase small subunit [Candidatus Binatia bacterium]|nr:cytochrome c nitrite reductase small subunit [Candidatus Binatia bacterium]